MLFNITLLKNSISTLSIVIFTLESPTIEFAIFCVTQDWKLDDLSNSIVVVTIITNTARIKYKNIFKNRLRFKIQYLNLQI